MPTPPAHRSARNRHDAKVGLNRRAFGKTVLAGLGAAALPSFLEPLGAQARRLKIGCTALIWGALPRNPENLEPALRDMTALGYHKFETFASIIEDWDKKGTLEGLMGKYPIPMVSVYQTVQLMDPAARKENVATLIRQGQVLKKYGGRFLVMAPNNVKREGYNFQEHRANIVAALNEYAKAVTDLGLGTGLHQHTGTCIESRDEVYAVMEAVNTSYLKFAPDVGQLQKGGSDPVKVLKDFLPITMHMHLKDFVGGEHFAGYCPLGQGKVDLKAILDMMEGTGRDANIMVELDGSPKQPITPLETGQISVEFLKKQGYTFRT